MSADRMKAQSESEISEVCAEEKASSPDVTATDSEAVAPTSPDRWQIAAASVCGTSHQRQGLPCQDAHAWQMLPSGAIAIAVADGAGSAAHSDRGSSVAVRAVIEFLRDRADGWLTEFHQKLPNTEVGNMAEGDRDVVGNKMENARHLFDRVLDALQTEADRANWQLAELATTLVVAIADACGAIAIQVGDGVAIVNDAAGEAIALTVPANGEYANETIFVTSQNARETIQVATWRGELRHLAVMTDGLQRLALDFPEATPHQPFFRPLFQFVAQTTDTDRACAKLADFLASPRVSDRADDDLTLVLAHRTDRVQTCLPPDRD